MKILLINLPKSLKPQQVISPASGLVARDRSADPQMQNLKIRGRKKTKAVRTDKR